MAKRKRLTLDDCVVGRDGEDVLIDRERFRQYIDEVMHPPGRWKSLLWLLVGVPVFLFLHFGPLGGA